jgi:beta-glucanase (GH16 family)
VVDGKLIIEAKEVTGDEQDAVQQECWDECGRRCVTKGFIDGTPELHTCVLGCGDNRCPKIRFTSARISTTDKFSISPSIKYPTIRVEARIQLPPGTGLWPAFWMLPQDSKYGIWPNSGEIDIMESHTAMNAVNGTIHYGGSGEAWRHTSVTTPLSPEFHVFRTDWSEKEIRWYVDDIMYGSVPNTGKGGRQGWYSAGADRSSTAPFGSGDNFFLLLNMAIGGVYPGSPSPDSVAQSMANGPKQMVVDYVRVMGR